MTAVLKTLEEIKRWMADSDERHDLLADQIAALQAEIRVDSAAAKMDGAIKNEEGRGRIQSSDNCYNSKAQSHSCFSFHVLFESQ